MSAKSILLCNDSMAKVPSGSLIRVRSIRFGSAPMQIPSLAVVTEQEFARKRTIILELVLRKASNNVVQPLLHIVEKWATRCTEPRLVRAKRQFDRSPCGIWPFCKALHISSSSRVPLLTGYVQRPTFDFFRDRQQPTVKVITCISF